MCKRIFSSENSCLYVQAFCVLAFWIYLCFHIALLQITAFSANFLVLRNKNGSLSYNRWRWSFSTNFAKSFFSRIYFLHSFNVKKNVSFWWKKYSISFNFFCTLCQDLWTKIPIIDVFSRTKKMFQLFSRKCNALSLFH